jgi:hypothetical protein
VTRALEAPIHPILESLGDYSTSKVEKKQKADSPNSAEIEGISSVSHP